MPAEDEGMDTYINTPFYDCDTYSKSISQIILVNGSSHGLIKFNLSSLPKETVSSATLEMSCVEGSPNTTAYRVTKEWLENEANWNEAKSHDSWTQPGGSYDQSSGVLGTTNEYNNVVSFNLTSMVTNWMSGAYPNNGVILTDYYGAITYGWV